LIENKDIFKFYDKNEKILALFQNTSDGSLSLKLSKNEIETELMHSDRGAFSETIYVYSPVIEFIVRYNLNPIFLSIGLGVGYIEIMIVAFLIGKSPHLLENNLFCIQSFESENILIKLFKGYFLMEEIPEPFKICYDKIIDLNSEYFLIEKDTLKNMIRNMILNYKIVFNKGFLENSNINNPAHGIFFDAFSAQSSPGLWEEKVLKNIFHRRNCSLYSSFATYASRTFLKKVLRENHFILEKKKGFSGKRECIFAERILEK
jgi:S-adenosyl-L-methionine-dependent methyltransferase